MTLNAEDIKILTLEKKNREIEAKLSPMPNGEERERLWRKSWNLHKQIASMVYDSGGNYRKDKRHLLTGSCLDINLI